MKIIQILVVALIIHFMGNLHEMNAQDVPVHPSITGVGHYHGLTPPLSDLPVLTPGDFMAMQESDFERNEALQHRSYPFESTALPQGTDPVWQKVMGTNRSGTGLILNFNGQPSPYYPPDPNGTAGPQYYMQTINSVYAIYDKTNGSLAAGPTDMNELFAGVPGSSCNDGDPLVLYDEQADRWLAVEFSICGSNDRMLIAVSQTNDPTGSWHAYSFDVADMPDYEKFGIWPDGYYMGTNNSFGNDIYVFEREPMLSGGTAQFVGFNNPWRPTTIDGFMCVPPLDNDGPAAPAGEPGMFITINDDAIGGGSDQLWIYELTADWANVNNSTFVRSQQISVPAFNSNFGNNWDNIKQPGTSQELDAIPQVIMNRPQYRNFGSYETIVCCHTVDLDNTDHAGIRWYELRRNGADWSIRQSGTFGPDEHSRWMGSISLNGQNELALGYSISSSTEYPGIRYCGQSASAYSAATGQMDIAEEIIHTGAFSQKSNNRWGDYTDLSIDPDNDRTFWYTNMYIATNSGARYTRIAAFEFEPQALEASFTASTVFPCIGGTVSFTDMSAGSPNSWEWTFEGGVPPGSAQQNPEVTYHAAGTFDVRLIVTNEFTSDTAFLEDYIHTVGQPAQPGTPAGPAEVCKGALQVEYTVPSVPDAIDYKWNIDPLTAGSISGADTVGYLDVAADYSGSLQVTVQALNNCGSSAFSEGLTVNTFAGPQVFNLPPEGGLCEGGAGYEIILDGSQVGISYELFLEGVSTGIIKQGTGSPLSFGFLTLEGTYSAIATDSNCSISMNGTTYLYYMNVPETAATPEGPSELCNSDSGVEFITAGAANASHYIWHLEPASAGQITGTGTTATVEWDGSFSGLAAITVQGANDCATGPISGSFQVSVLIGPHPEVTGQVEPCSVAINALYTYSTSYNAVNDYFWKIEGGSLVTGQGKGQVLVTWSAPGQGKITLTENTPNGCFGKDSLEVTIFDCTGIPEGEKGRVLIFPNPVEDKLTIRTVQGEPGLQTLRIFSNYGQPVWQDDILVPLGHLDYTISTSNIPHGVYFVQIITPSGRLITAKFVKAVK